MGRKIRRLNLFKERVLTLFVSVLISTDPQDIPALLQILADYILGSPYPGKEIKWMESAGHLDMIEELQLIPGLLPSVISFFENFRQYQTAPGNWGFCIGTPMDFPQSNFF